MQRVRGAKVALRIGARWMEGRRKTGSGSLGKRKGERSALNHFASKNCQQRVDWFSHMPPFHVFCHFLILPRFQHILNPQNCFVSKGATQNSSLSFRVSDTEVWQFIWSVSRPGSEGCLHLCSLAQSLSAFGQIPYLPARRGWWQTIIYANPSFSPS